MDPKGPGLLAHYLRRHGLTAEDLATRLRVAPGTVTRWIRGDRTPRPAHRSLITKMTGGDVPNASWQTADERAADEARRAWLAAHPLGKGAEV